jgi:large subunit ribosomal protein L24
MFGGGGENPVARRVHVKKGDTVRVICGEDLGKTGKVLEVHPHSQRVVVDGIAIVKRHTKPTQTNPQGGVVERPAAVHASNLMLVCTNCNRPSRVRRLRAADGGVVRECKRCGRAID